MAFIDRSNQLSVDCCSSHVDHICSERAQSADVCRIDVLMMHALEQAGHDGVTLIGYVRTSTLCNHYTPCAVGILSQSTPMYEAAACAPLSLSHATAQVLGVDVRGLMEPGSSLLAEHIRESCYCWRWHQG